MELGVDRQPYFVDYADIERIVHKYFPDAWADDILSYISVEEMPFLHNICLDLGKVFLHVMVFYVWDESSSLWNMFLRFGVSDKDNGDLKPLGYDKEMLGVNGYIGVKDFVLNAADVAFGEGLKNTLEGLVK